MLHKLLPSYEVPSIYINVNTLIQNGNGKIDKALSLKKIAIVSATSNNLRITYPAFSDSVIGVRHNIRGIGGKLIYLDHSGFGVNVEASSPSFILDSSNEKLMLHPCNSFAAPVVTSVIYNIIEKMGVFL